MKHLMTICAGAALIACAAPAGASVLKPGPNPIIPAKTEAPAGVYTLDPTHASLLFRVNHMGFSNYTARFKRFDATLNFNPAKPEMSTVTAKVDVSSLETDYPKPQPDFNAELIGDKFLNAAKFPSITFTSTKVRMIANNKARIYGDLEMHGVKRPIMLEATFNGGYKGMAMDPGGRIGFSAHGTLKRSEYGVPYGIPAPGSRMGVGDDVEVIIEAEFKAK